MRVFGYVRVSSEPQADGTSPDRQRTNCKQWASDRFGKTARVFEEPGKTGASLNRPEFQRMLSLVGPGDVIVVNTLDRLTRDIDNLWEVRLYLRRIGARGFCVIKEMEITTASLNELLQVLIEGWFSQAELERITYRLQTGRKDRMTEGEAAFGNTPPFGYKAVKRLMPDGHTGTFLEINPKEAEIVRLIYDLFLSRNLSSAQVAHKLNEMGIPSPAVWRGKKSRGWYSSRVRTILKSSTYHGIYRWGGVVVPVPSIVSHEEQVWAMRQLRSNIRFSEKDAKHQYLLRGLIRCAECNHTYTGSVSGGHKYYGCEGRKHPQKYNMERCHAPHLPGDNIETRVWSEFVGIIERPEGIEVYIDRQTEIDDINTETELVLLDNRIEMLERERVNAMRASFRETIVDDEALNRAMEEINSQLAASKKTRSEVLAHVQRDELWRASVMETRQRLYELQSVVRQDLPDDLRRELLQELVKRIEVGIETIKMRIIASSFGGVNYGKGPAVPSADYLPKSPLVIEIPTIDILRKA